ncbi:MAG: AAA family ATPase, partial [Pseudonocardia sp.]|nr:AAA family ATPase [Pseudonocardia sp.]
MAEAPRGPRLVGRVAELARLTGRLDVTAAGHGGFVLISGEPGIGKSLLAAATAELAERRDFDVRWGRCAETDGAPPFWPWMQVLTGIGDDPASEPLLTVATPADADRFRLFDSVSRVLGQAASTRPVLVLLDDLHRADAASLALLRFVVPALGRTRMLVLGSYRHTEVPPAHPLSRLLGEVAGDLTVELVELSGLSRAATAELVAEVAGSDSVTDVDQVHRRTGGNPFFLTELLRLGTSTGSRVPSTIGAAVRARVLRLPTETRDLLTVAAVLGRDIDADLLARVADRPLLAVLAALAPAVESGFVTDHEGATSYRFVHILVQQTLYAEQPEDRRVLLHDRVVSALQSGAGPGPDGGDSATTALVAHHAGLAVGVPGGRERALATAWAAARAADRLADEQAADWYGRALRSGPSEDERADLLLGLGRSAGRAGRTEDARRAFEEAWALARGAGRPDRFVRAALGLGEVVVSAGTVDTGLVRMLERTLDALSPDARDERVRLSARLATELYWGAGLARARRIAARTVVDARELGDTPALAAALAAHQFVLRGPDDLDRRLRIGTELVGRAIELGDDELELTARRMLIPDLLQTEPVVADGEMGALADLAATSRRPLARWYLLLFRAARAIMAGDAAASELVGDALALGRRIRVQPAPVYACGQRFVLLRQLGRLGEIEDELRRLAARYPVLATFRCQLALLLAEGGRTTEAGALLHELSEDGCVALPPDSLWLANVGILAEVAALLDDAERAAMLGALLAPHRGRVAMLGVPVWCGAVDRPLAMTAAA